VGDGVDSFDTPTLFSCASWLTPHEESTASQPVLVAAQQHELEDSDCANTGTVQQHVRMLKVMQKHKKR
jgi:hypothetical protein